MVRLRFRRFLAVAVSALLLTTTLLQAQQPPPAAAKPTEQPKPAEEPKPPVPAAPLKIIVLQGEGAKNNVRAKTAIAPAVEVRDENEKPVPGAEVVFQLPATGPSGIFHGWMRTQTVKTNAQGQATVTGYMPNEEEGRFNIKVTANTRTQSGSAVIAQTNVRLGGVGSTTRAKRSSWWAVAAVGAAIALGGGIYAATRGDKTESAVTPTIPVTITPGSITVGGPR